MTHNGKLKVFQFHIGSIKRLKPSASRRRPNAGFNSTLVQLKDSLARSTFPCHCTSFNSTLVQLKAYNPKTKRYYLPKFQFHIGSIKSSLVNRVLYLETKFQFHIGSIKSHVRIVAQDPKTVFQFHIGSIKRVGRRVMIGGDFTFQFHIGSIKRKLNPSSKAKIMEVSIPHWFN